MISYLVDLLLRRHKLKLEDLSLIFASPFWKVIDDLPEEKKLRLTKLRIIYASALLNGPFGIIVAGNNFMLGLNDRIKLRPLVHGKNGDMLYIASEESAIIAVDKDVKDIYTPRGGEPIIGRLK